MQDDTALRSCSSRRDETAPVSRRRTSALPKHINFGHSHFPKNIPNQQNGVPKINFPEFPGLRFSVEILQKSVPNMTGRAEWSAGQWK